MKKQVCLITVADVVNGKELSMEKSKCGGSGKIPYIKITDISSEAERTIMEGEEFIPREIAEKNSLRIVPKHTILLSTRGQFGHIAIVGTEVCINQGIHAIIPQKNVDAMFLYYYLKSNMNRILMEKQGKVMALMKIKELNAFRICIPSDIQEQKEIGRKLSLLDNQIECNRKMIQILLEETKEYFMETFVEKQSDTWKKGTLGDLAEIIRGATPNVVDGYYTEQGGTVWISNADIEDNKVIFISRGAKNVTALGRSKTSLKTISKGSVLFSLKGKKEHIAITLNEVTAQVDIKGIVPKKEVGAIYIYYLLKFLIPYMKLKAGKNEVSAVFMRNIETVIPDVETLRSFNDFAEIRFKKIRTFEYENQMLEANKQKMMLELFGER